MVFERVVFMCAVLMCAILGSFPQRLRNIRNGRYGLGRANRRLGDVSRTMAVVFGMRVMMVLVIMGMPVIIVMVVVMMRGLAVVVGVIGVVLVVVLVVMAVFGVSMGGLVRSLCRCLQA